MQSMLTDFPPNIATTMKQTLGITLAVRSPVLTFDDLEGEVIRTDSIWVSEKI